MENSDPLSPSVGRVKKLCVICGSSFWAVSPITFYIHIILKYCRFKTCNIPMWFKKIWISCNWKTVKAKFWRDRNLDRGHYRVRLHFYCLHLQYDHFRNDLPIILESYNKFKILSFFIKLCRESFCSLYRHHDVFWGDTFQNLHNLKLSEYEKLKYLHLYIVDVKINTLNIQLI